MDLSFSLDENGNSFPFKVPSLPNATSTPQKIKKKITKQLICSVCGKTYQLQHYYNIHLQTHNSPDTSSTTPGNPDDLNDSIANVSNALHVDTSDLSFRQLQSDQNTCGTFKVPNAPQKKKKVITSKGVKKPKFICTYCLKGYQSDRYFKSHMRTHAIQDAAARFPDTIDILNNCDDIADKALLSVSKCVSIGESGQNFKHLVGYIASVAATQEWKNFCHDLCDDMLHSIKDKKCILPAPLVTYLIDRVEVINASEEKSGALLNVLNIHEMFESNVLSQFLLEFSLELVTEIMRFICKTFRRNYPQRLEKVIAEPDKEDRNVIYYIAGSIMRGYLKIARRAEKSVTWKSVAAALKSNILIDRPEGDMIPDSEWTKDVDRGSLLYVNTECQNFFVALTKVVYASEQRDGSIDYELVIKRVTESELSVEWGNIISDSLPEIVSVNLMNDVVLCFCRTCGRGFAKKRLNFLKEKPTVSMPTRHLVASRKNR
ncbi:Gastrula zinc finger protein XlCGF62.1 [Frankliniella fusca]|uniref:Gastrula zinc finger protein XlCGF62.1 n=1 Tax=Frankliniella fusca TaxID=407009 RepID=A0AAE1HHH4_9NEOP|nr:Gastrula zinc finger protein XlCGF62.1 [Frankliniella fusca]